MAIGWRVGAGADEPAGMAQPLAIASPARVAGAGLVGCAVASVALLMAHPEGAASPVLADVLRSEAAQRLADAVVHGGFVVVLTLELVGFAALAVRAGPGKTTVLAAMLFALVGSGLLAGSMVADGLITPAVAARYAASPVTRQEASRALLVLLGASISVLMPMGLAFLGASALAWGAALTPGSARIGGAVALTSGAITLAATAASVMGFGMLGLMIALLSSTAWVLAAGVVLARWPAQLR